MKRKVIALICTSMTVCAIGCGKTSDEAVKETVTETVKEPEYVYGTATLSYGEFYDGVSSATTGKYEIFPNMDTDFVDEETNADGYHINGIKNVNIAVPADSVDDYKAINDTFVESSEEPSQYKVVTIEDGKAVYSETKLNVVDTVTDADGIAYRNYLGRLRVRCYRKFDKLH